MWLPTQNELTVAAVIYVAAVGALSPPPWTPGELGRWAYRFFTALTPFVPGSHKVSPQEKP